MWSLKPNLVTVGVRESFLITEQKDERFRAAIAAYIFQGKHAKFKKYVGHSAHVTNVRWTNGDSRLVSVGGADTSVMVWSHARAHDREEVGGDSDDSDTDSEEEGGYDSDVEREKNLTYEDKIYANPLRTTKGVKPHLREKQDDEEHR